MPHRESEASASQSRRWQVRGDLDCLGCTHNLRGLTGPIVTCPECRHQNDLRDPEPWRQAAISAQDSLHFGWPTNAVGLSILIPIAFYVSMLLFRRSTLLVFLNSAGITLLIIGGWVMLSRHWIRSCPSKARGWKLLINAHALTWLSVLGILLLGICLKKGSGGWMLFVGFGFIALSWACSNIEDHHQREDIGEGWEDFRLPLEADDAQQQ